jgi:hypothetical protein
VVLGILLFVLQAVRGPCCTGEEEHAETCEEVE